MLKASKKSRANGFLHYVCNACLKDQFLFINYLSIATVRKGLLKRVECNFTHLEKLM